MYGQIVRGEFEGRLEVHYNNDKTHNDDIKDLELYDDSQLDGKSSIEKFDELVVIMKMAKDLAKA